jgi:hypothetical protein
MRILLQLSGLLLLVSAYRLAVLPQRRLAAAISMGSSDDLIAAGTPFARPKIGDSIVDLIGGTPMVLIPLSVP